MSHARKRSALKASRAGDKRRDTNILLLGPTGVGKSTFINAFANYLSYNSVEDGLKNELLAVIASSLSFSDRNTFETIKITIGEESEYEKFTCGPYSTTKRCRSFVFPLGRYRLRLIDTPGIGDIDGLNQDEENLRELLNFIANFEHLNAICILLKPNETRLTIQLRYYINELVRHLHFNAAANLVFVFTHVRSTTYRIGSTASILKGLLGEYSQTHGMNIPFDRSNTFLFDSEAFIYFAMSHKKIDLDDSCTTLYQNSWTHSTNEFSRFLSHIVKCPRHQIREKLSLNEAEQLIRKLPRPLAETQNLIQTNINLAEEFQRRASADPQSVQQNLTQNSAVIKKLKFPQTVCASEKCRRIVHVDGEIRVEYTNVCHDQCYLKGIEQETLAHPDILLCESIDPETNMCKKCGCHAQSHIHISYIYNTNRTDLDMSIDENTNTSQQRLNFNALDQRIRDLRSETETIQKIYQILTRFLHSNCLLPFNDAYVGYLDYYIKTQESNSCSRENNATKIARLKELKDDFENYLKILKVELDKLKHDERRQRSQLQLFEVTDLVEELYNLPISGVQIREQVDGIEIAGGNGIRKHEVFVELPGIAADSVVMKALLKIISE